MRNTNGSTLAYSLLVIGVGVLFFIIHEQKDDLRNGTDYMNRQVEPRSRTPWSYGIFFCQNTILSTNEKSGTFQNNSVAMNIAVTLSSLKKILNLNKNNNMILVS